MSIIYICLALIALKSLTIGSEFSFYKWFKYKSHYTYWYFNRSEYNPSEETLTDVEKIKCGKCGQEFETGEWAFIGGEKFIHKDCAI